jgi:hypothetical protein
MSGTRGGGKPSNDKPLMLDADVHTMWSTSRHVDHSPVAAIGAYNLRIVHMLKPRQLALPLRRRWSLPLSLVGKQTTADGILRSAI